MGSESQASGASMAPRSSRILLKMPALVSLSISSQRRAEITVGIAQGTSMTARMAPRPRNLELTTIAMNRPIKQFAGD